MWVQECGDFKGPMRQVKAEVELGANQLIELFQAKRRVQSQNVPTPDYTAFTESAEKCCSASPD